MTYTLVVYISYNMANRDLPDIYAHALGPAALRLGHIYQANPSCPCYSLYRIAQNFGGGIFWRIWRTRQQPPKIYPPKFHLIQQS